MEISFIWLLSFIISAFIGYKKGNPLGGAFLGLVLGPIGLIIVLLSENKNRLPCPHCAEEIMKDAKICPHCHREVILIRPPK